MLDNSEDIHNAEIHPLNQTEPKVMATHQCYILDRD